MTDDYDDVVRAMLADHDYDDVVRAMLDALDADDRAVLDGLDLEGL